MHQYMNALRHRGRRGSHGAVEHSGKGKGSMRGSELRETLWRQVCASSLKEPVRLGLKLCMISDRLGIKYE